MRKLLPLGISIVVVLIARMTISQEEFEAFSGIYYSMYAVGIGVGVFITIIMFTGSEDDSSPSSSHSDGRDTLEYQIWENAQIADKQREKEEREREKKK